MIAPRILSVIAASLMLVCGPVRACGLEGGPGDALSAAAEGSLELAFATRDALASGWLSPLPELAQEAAHERADEGLQAFVAVLPAASRGARAFAVLLVEPGVWTRVSPKAGRWSLATHIDKPEGRETVLLASEPLLYALSSGRVSAAGALAAGVLAVRGEPAQRERLISALRQSYPGSAKTALR